MKFIVLKTRRDTKDDGAQFHPMAGRDMDVPISAAPTFTLAEASDLTPRDLAEIGRQGDIAAPSMPMALIAPISADRGIPAAVAPRTSWGIEAVKAVTASRTGDGIKMAVLDTGIDRNHPAFKGVTIDFRNFTKEGDDDTNGHGTHCAGTIFGRDVDGRRIGIARGVQDVLIGKVLGAGGGSSETLIEAVNWAWEKGAHIISMSLGIDFVGYRDRLVAKGMPDRQATSHALAGYMANVRLFDRLSQFLSQTSGIRSSLLVAASGNESDREHGIRITVGPPAVGDDFISVAALGPAPAGTSAYPIANFSNTCAKLAAPGVDIWSAKTGGGLMPLSGTSMAAPHVAGVAALWAEDLVRRRNPKSINARNIVQAMMDSRQSLDHLEPSDAVEGLVQSPQRT